MTDRETLRQYMATTLGVDVSRLTDETPLIDLVSSSILLVELIIELQEEFNVRFQQSDMGHITKVGELLDLLQRRLAADA